MKARGLMVMTAVCLGAGALLPATAGADATLASENSYSQAQGLPDGRVYEQVSPANKHGQFAGVNSGGNAVRGSVARADGNALLFGGTGPMGDAVSGIDEFFVATRSGGGWSTRSALPAPKPPYEFVSGPAQVAASPDLDQLAYRATAAYTSALDPEGTFNLFLAGSNPLVEPVWASQPTAAQIEPPLGQAGEGVAVGAAAGPPSDEGTLYFAYRGTLLPQDISRASHALQDPGLYRWTPAGGLVPADVLPNEAVPSAGAAPAGVGRGDEPATGATFDNQVSRDGRRVFFVSPEPHFCEVAGPAVPECGQPPQLYLRETAADGSQRTVLVSRDELLGAVEGRPAPAPHGPLRIPNPHFTSGVEETYVYATSDGAHAFFESVDGLTDEAKLAEAGGGVGAGAPKAYEFDVATGRLTYLAGVTDGQGGVAPIQAATPDGSHLIFIRLPSQGEEPVSKKLRYTVYAPSELAMWSAVPGGGSVTAIASLPLSSVQRGQGESGTFVTSARAGGDGSAFVFETDAPLAGFNDGGFYQVYRYDIAAGALACVSCPPRGTAPTGNAELSHFDMLEAFIGGSRGVSSDGRRIFFDTPDPLVAQDVDGTRDVYEWENGTVYLISSGTSAQDSVYLDSSEEGGDVFFATAAGLLAGDTDNAYDVYDARVPQPGDSPPARAVPCQGSACQGPPSPPVPSGFGASAAFFGAGNPAGGGSTRSGSTAPKRKVKRPARRRHEKRAGRRPARTRRSSAHRSKG